MELTSAAEIPKMVASFSHLGSGMDESHGSWRQDGYVPQNKKGDFSKTGGAPFFPTCQTRWGLLDFITVVLLLRLLLLHLLLLLLPLLQLLLHHLCIHSHVHFRLANSSPSSSPTSGRSGHCWTSTARVWAHWAPTKCQPSFLKRSWIAELWPPNGSAELSPPNGSAELSAPNRSERHHAHTQAWPGVSDPPERIATHEWSESVAYFWACLGL